MSYFYKEALKLIEKEKQEKSGTLNLYNLLLREVPESIHELIHLHSLDLSGNLISDYSFLENLINLQSLNLRGNLISDYNFLTSLSNLQSLNLSYTHISDYNFLKNLTDLEFLSLRGNQIENISSLLPLIRKKMEVSIGEYITKGINLSDNPISTPPIEVVKQGREAILSYFDSLENLKSEEKVPLNEVKILLLGEGKAGKTSLLKRLKGLPFKKDESQTHGVIIEELMLNKLPLFRAYDPIKAVKGRFWDFGGQEIMHASHQFFLTNRSLYILLIDSRNDAKKDYWLKHIEKFGGGSPAIVAINKIDINKNYEVERKTLNQKYPFIGNRFHRISCNTGDGLPELAKTIAELIPDTEIFTTSFSIYWIRVKEALEEATAAQNYIDQAQFERICKDHKVTDKTQQKTLLGYLNSLGIILHFENLELQNFFVLDPHWVTIGVYKIINSESIEKGILKESQLDYILNHEVIKKGEYDPAKEKSVTYSTSEQAYLVCIMEEFKLLYKLGNGQYLIPDLLSVEPLSKVNIDKTNNNHIHFILQYDFLPNTVMSRFIIAMKNDIQDRNLLWRTGVVLKNSDNATALVHADNADKRIYICVSGESKNKRDYFSVIRHHLLDIAKSFSDLKITQLIRSSDGETLVDYEELLGYERAGRDEYFVGKTGKTYSVSKDFLDKVSTKIQRGEELRNKGQIIEYEALVNPTPPVEKVKKWYEFHWVISAGKALLLAIPITLSLYVTNQILNLQFNYIWAVGPIVLCLASLLFINRDPKYKYYRRAMFIVGLIGIVNILPALNTQFKWTDKTEAGNFDFIFRLGIQDNWLVTVVLFIIVLVLLYMQRDKEVRG